MTQLDLLDLPIGDGGLGPTRMIEFFDPAVYRRVDCVCGARAGEPCREGNGYGYSGAGVHAGRIKLALERLYRR